MKTGIIGFPQSGKKTIFETLTGAEVPAGSYGQAVTQVVAVPDSRVTELSRIFQPKKTTYAQLEFTVFPSLEDTGGKRKGVLAEISICDLLAFTAGVHMESTPEAISKKALSEVGNLNDLFTLSDLVIIEDKLERIGKGASRGQKESPLEKEALLKCKVWLEDGKPLRTAPFNEEESRLIRNYQFLTQKPLVVVVNVSEDHIHAEGITSQVAVLLGESNASCLQICGALERDIAFLPEAERPEFLQTYGIEEPAFPHFIRECYRLLNLCSFFTAGEDECRAWTIERGTDAQHAAGVIHSDLQRGFIRAEVISYADFMEIKSLTKAKDLGKIGLKGKDYLVEDGDILNIRFNV